MLIPWSPVFHSFHFVKWTSPTLKYANYMSRQFKFLSFTFVHGHRLDSIIDKLIGSRQFLAFIFVNLGHVRLCNIIITWSWTFLSFQYSTLDTRPTLNYDKYMVPGSFSRFILRPVDTVRILKYCSINGFPAVSLVSFFVNWKRPTLKYHNYIVPRQFLSFFSSNGHAAPD